MPSRKMNDVTGPDRVLNRLNQKLNPTDIKQANDMLVQHLYNNDIDPVQFKVNTSTVNSIIGHLEDVYKVWEGLPDPIEPVFTSEAIVHLTQTLRNQVGKCIKTTISKINAPKNAESLDDGQSEESPQIKDEPPKE